MTKLQNRCNLPKEKGESFPIIAPASAKRRRYVFGLLPPLTVEHRFRLVGSVAGRTGQDRTQKNDTDGCFSSTSSLRNGKYNAPDRSPQHGARGGRGSDHPGPRRSCGLPGADLAVQEGTKTGHVPKPGPGRNREFVPQRPTRPYARRSANSSSYYHRPLIGRPGRFGGVFFTAATRFKVLPAAPWRHSDPTQGYNWRPWTGGRDGDRVSVPTLRSSGGGAVCAYADCPGRGSAPPGHCYQVHAPG